MADPTAAIPSLTLDGASRDKWPLTDPGVDGDKWPITKSAFRHEKWSTRRSEALLARSVQTDQWDKWPVAADKWPVAADKWPLS